MSDELHAAPRRPMEHLDPETIAAWLDEPDELSAEERATIEQHLAGCAECQQVAADLRALVAALAALPEVSPPRSFALAEEHAQPALDATREPIPLRASSRWYDRQMRALRWATAAAAILFVFVLGVDLVTTRLDRPVANESAAVAQREQSFAGDGATPASGETMAAKAASGETPTPGPEAAALAASPETTEATPAAADAAGAATQPTPVVEREVRPETSRREERLRLLEVGLATLFVWLLAMMIALPRLRRRRGNRS